MNVERVSQCKLEVDFLIGDKESTRTILEIVVEQREEFTGSVSLDISGLEALELHVVFYILDC